MRVALITGASSGIGLATAQAFVEAGIAVAGVSRDANKLAAMERQLAGKGAPVATMALDARDGDAPARAVGPQPPGTSRRRPAPRRGPPPGPDRSIPTT